MTTVVAVAFLVIAGGVSYIILKAWHDTLESDSQKQRFVKVSLSLVTIAGVVAILALFVPSFLWSVGVIVAGLLALALIHSATVKDTLSPLFESGHDSVEIVDPESGRVVTPAKGELSVDISAPSGNIAKDFLTRQMEKKRYQNEIERREWIIKLAETTTEFYKINTTSERAKREYVDEFMLQWGTTQLRPEDEQIFQEKGLGTFIQYIKERQGLTEGDLKTRRLEQERDQRKIQKEITDLDGASTPKTPADERAEELEAYYTAEILEFDTSTDNMIDAHKAYKVKREKILMTVIFQRTSGIQPSIVWKKNMKSFFLSSACN